MKFPHSLTSLVCALLLLCISAQSSALTLGRARGAALLGQPLELTVAVQGDGDEGTAGQCFEAEVYYGDIRQESSRVAVSAEPAGAANALTVHVSAYARVDEPVVTVYLRAGCGLKTSRRYVLLADLTSEPAPSAVPAVTATARTAPPVTRVPPVADAVRAPLEPAQATAAPRPEHIKRPDVAAEARAPKPKSPDAMVSNARRGEKRARLKLSAPDLDVRDPELKISREMATAAMDDMQKRVEAIALWRSLNVTPADVLRDGSRLQSLETDLKSLQQLTARNKQALADMEVRLEQARSDRYANPLVYGLLILLLICGVALVFVWTRRRESGGDAAPWWRNQEVDAPAPQVTRSSALERNSALAKAPEASPESESGSTQPPVVAGVKAVDIDLEMGESVFAGIGAPAGNGKTPSVAASARPAQRLEHRDFSPSAMGTLRAINTQEMLDVRQQAEFFMTLGQYEEAIALLENAINESGEANPLVYLDLLKVFHTLSRKEDYDHYRDSFNQLFTGHVPSYTGFNRGGKSLEAYPDICQRITELWPSQGVVDYIEDCLVRKPEDGVAQEFDLEAYRELLMLHAVARRMDGSTSDSDMVPFSTSKLTVPSLTAGLYGADATVAVSPVQSSEPSVDLDLSEPEPKHNLIDFEVSGFSKEPAPAPRKP